MAVFRVGQRVRILWCRGWPELAGGEGTLRKPSIIGLGPNAGMPGWSVIPDVWGSECAPCMSSVNGGWYFTALESQLAPIQPERNQIVSWSECLWQPNHIKESA